MANRNLLRVRLRAGGAASLNPASLFANGEIGFWGNLSDFATLFQDSSGLTPVTAAGQSIGRINSALGGSVYAVQATGSKKPILKRQPVSGIRNLLSDSGDLFAGSDWGSSANWSQVSVNPYHATSSAYRVINDGAVSSRNFTKSIGVSNGNATCLSVIFEKSASDTALKSVIAIRDITASAFVARVDLNWADGTIAIINGAGSREKLSDSGPNGGAVYRLVCAGTMPAGNAVARFIYPTSTNTNTESIIIHSCQYESGSAATAYQRTFGGYDVYEEGFKQVYWIDYDGVDDEMVLNNPDLGVNATRVRAQLGAPVIDQGLTLGANLALNTDNLGLIMINRALTDDELASITNYYTRMVS